MAYKDNLTEYGFGQLGSGYLADTSLFVPPDGKVVVAITCIADTKFNILKADTSGYTDGETGGTGGGYFGTLTQKPVNGTSSDAVAGTHVFPRGVTIYGRWTQVDLTSGKVILYFGT